MSHLPRTPVSRGAAAVVALLTLAPLSPGSLEAQAPPGTRTVTVIPNEEYDAGGFYRMFFGTRYRKLWTTPIRVPVLDLATYGGGLTPTQKGGGAQTRSLRMKGGDGKEYQFRSVNKDPTGLLPEQLQNTFAAEILQDQMSSAHPAAAVVVPPLLEAAGVLHPVPVLVQMPDDARLGEFRSEFAGLLGTIEERPRGMDEGVPFEGASDVVSTDGLYERLDKDPTVKVDAREFLLARLTDIYIGDWDRHRDQWRWALLERGGRKRWLPIPRDRDQAFVRFDGFMLSQARRTAPQLLNFGSKYGDIVGHTWNGRDIDRRLLTELDEPVYDSVAAVLQSRMTDQAIARAAALVPPEYQPLDADRLTSALKTRRERIDEMARKYYDLLADRVEVWASDKDDEAKVTLNEDGTTTVTLSADGVTYYTRRFDPDDTDEVRVYLQGGNDRFTVEGASRGSPVVRAIGAGGDDRYVLTARSGVRLYDEKGDNLAEGGKIRTKLWNPPIDTTRESALPPRDWGKKTLTAPFLFIGPDVGLMIGWGGITNWYGFRQLPSARRVTYHGVYATGEKSGRIALGYKNYGENSPSHLWIDAIASGIEVLRWYGFGNETVSQATSFHRLDQNVFGLALGWGLRWGERNEFTLGPMVKWSDTDLDHRRNRDRFIAQDAPYGTGRFGMAGVEMKLDLDGRDIPKFATRGARLRLRGSVVPKAWDVDETFYKAGAEGSFTLAPGGRWQPSLNFMAGGEWTSGQLPYFEAPTLGGFRTLRGYRSNRFAGEKSAYGSAELRLPLTRIRFFVPGEQGVFGFGDAGRVWVEGEDSNELQTSFGGGIFMNWAGRGNVLVAGIGVPSKKEGGDKGGRFFLGFGFPY
ncbi:MAG: BamA/TamA family outer membrane protein [Gemmatimonadales bacterium]